ncbi:MAG: hypothetical protein M1823_004850 [Watsoniomyces obsoletus]|nr:MAG: hypothetical protein M1823_004850 [Watsoniomyces obsoletus]
MADLIRDAPLGQVIRFITGNRSLLYPEERPDFQLPSCYSQHPSDLKDAPKESVEKEVGTAVQSRTSQESNDLERAITAADLQKATTRTELSKVGTQAELAEAYTRATMEKGPSVPVVPEKLDDGTILVNWYSTTDPDNPQNWPSSRKNLVTLQIWGVMAQFNVSATVASLGLALYVLAYGIGPLLFSPLSEIPSLGRNVPYMFTFAIFVILSVPTAIVNNFAGLMVLRFLQGFFGSPCLATGGASLSDIYSLMAQPYAIACWALFATCGPALGPLLSAYAVMAKDWHWALWEIVWLSGPTFLVLFCFLPETSASNILLRRARRLRKLTGNPNFKSQSEIDQANISARQLLVESLWRPLQIMFLDVQVAFIDLYTALSYAIFYSFFESFEYLAIYYGFNAGSIGLSFLSISVSVFISLSLYLAYIHWVVNPEIRRNGLPAPEKRLIPGLLASFCLPVGLFIFAWTCRTSVHWIVPLIGVTIFSGGVFIIFQCLFVFLPLSFPNYAASLFATNDFLRSTFAAGAILYARPLFHDLGIGPGVSLLAGLTVGCIVGIFLLYKYAPALRKRSRFTAK